MQKLNKEITATFYHDAEGYAQLVALWSRTMQDRALRRQLTAAHHLLYLILRGRNWQKAFAPVTNPTKRDNGGFYNWGARKAVLALHSEGYVEMLLTPFAEVVKKEALNAIRALVPPLDWNENPLEREPYHV